MIGSFNRINAYRTMWVLVLFDLPTDTKKDRKDYSDFRKNLLNNGFDMLQFSIYARHCASIEHAEVHCKRVKAILPPRGQVGVMTITDKQMSKMQVYYGTKISKPPGAAQQLVMFE